MPQVGQAVYGRRAVVLAGLRPGCELWAAAVGTVGTLRIEAAAVAWRRGIGPQARRRPVEGL